MSALNKYWRPVTAGELGEMDLDDIQNAISISGFPKAVINWVWEKKRTAFEVY